jgi:hypothetical protein
MIKVKHHHLSKYLFLVGCLFQSMDTMATGLTPLPFGHAAFLYDAYADNGPDASTSNPVTNHPGQWRDNIQSFNAGATTPNVISRLYVYGTSLDTTGTYNTVNYDNSYAIASIASYRTRFPNITILAIVDGTPGLLKNGDQTAIQLANDLATSLVTQVCAHSDVDGVFYDIEPTKFNVSR